MAPATPLTHADVVHHEQVDVQAGSAGPPGAHEVSACMLDQLDTAAPALHQGGHVRQGGGPVERVVTPRIRPAGTFKTVYRVPC